MDAPSPVLGMILKGYPRISETFISNEILLLSELGLRIRIFSMRQPRESFSHASVQRIRARVDYLPETLLRPLPRLLAHNLALARRQPGRYRQALGLARRRLAAGRPLATIKHLLQAGYLVGHLLPGSGVGHLHAHFAHSPTSVARFASLLAGLPFSFTAHAKDIYTSEPSSLAEKIAAAAFVVTCTEHNRQYLARLAYGSTPIHRIYHGIDLSLFSAPAAGPAAPAAPFQILTVARLTAKKGLDTVLRAVRRLADQGLPVRHTLIGAGEERSALETLARQLGLAGICSWLGTQPHQVVQAQLAQAHLFVLGCRIAANGDRDGIPNVLAESLAMGVPVVATTVSAIPELVEDGASGLLVPPDDPAAMAAAMARLLTDPGLRQQVIAAGRQRVAQGFDNRQLIGQLAALFRGALAAPD
ncbi:MAG: glycosyltransferase [Thermodesulfobacteriota bacterium]